MNSGSGWLEGVGRAAENGFPMIIGGIGLG